VLELPGPRGAREDSQVGDEAYLVPKPQVVDPGQRRVRRVTTCSRRSSSENPYAQELISRLPCSRS